MNSWDGKDRRGSGEEFGKYKELILSEINNLKTDFKEFKDDIYSKYEKLKDSMNSKHQELFNLLNEMRYKLIGGMIVLTSVISVGISLASIFFKG
jgi:hypothetical protein